MLQSAEQCCFPNANYGKPRVVLAVFAPAIYHSRSLFYYLILHKKYPLFANGYLCQAQWCFIVIEIHSIVTWKTHNWITNKTNLHTQEKTGSRSDFFVFKIILDNASAEGANLIKLNVDAQMQFKCASTIEAILPPECKSNEQFWWVFSRKIISRMH